MARVLVTRAQPEADALAATLRAAGHVAVLAPLATRIALPLAWPDTPPEALIFTSPAAPALALAAPHDVPVFAIGARTAQAARAAGFDRIAADSRSDYRVLLAAIAAAPANRFWHVGGRELRHDVAADVAALGKVCTSFAAYDMEPASDLPAEAAAALAARALDTALLLSPRTAERAARLLVAAKDWLPVWALSPEVAAPLQDAGWRTIHISSAPQLPMLLAEAGLIHAKGKTDD